MHPIVPHFASECLADVKYNGKLEWPILDKKYLIKEKIDIVVQVNGKKRMLISVPDNTEEESKDVIEKASPRKQRASTKTTDSVEVVNSEKDDQKPDKKVKSTVKKKAPSKARAGKKDS